MCIITPTVLVALPDSALTARILLAKWHYTTLWVLKTNILRSRSILIHKTFVTLALFSHSLLFEGCCIFQLLAMSERIGFRNVLLSSWSLVCIFCNLAAPRGSGRDEGFGILGTIWACKWRTVLGMQSLMVVFRSAAPEQLFSHKVVLGGMRDCPDGAGSEVRPGAAMRHCKGHCWHSACAWCWKWWWWESCTAGEQLSLLLDRWCRGCRRCRDTADIWLRFPVNPVTHTLYVLRVAQGCFLANRRWTLTHPSCKDLQKRSEEVENQISVSEVSLVQLLEQPPLGFWCCSWSQAALDCSHLLQGYAPATAWCIPVPEPKRSREHCLMPFRALVASAHCKLHLPSSKVETFADILYYVSVALLCLFGIKATIKMQAN